MWISSEYQSDRSLEYSDPYDPNIRLRPITISSKQKFAKRHRGSNCEGVYTRMKRWHVVPNTVQRTQPWHVTEQVGVLQNGGLLRIHFCNDLWSQVTVPSLQVVWMGYFKAATNQMCYEFLLAGESGRGCDNQRAFASSHLPCRWKSFEVLYPICIY